MTTRPATPPDGATVNTGAVTALGTADFAVDQGPAPNAFTALSRTEVAPPAGTVTVCPPRPVSVSGTAAPKPDPLSICTCSAVTASPPP